jgi:serine/threonine protein kinase/tetratricopeptide (TPR) repeat protein
VSASEDPLVGATVGQYQILARVGGGGMGVVYTARAAKLGRVVALKFLPPQWSHDDNAKQRFLREAQAASATNHPNICTIHDIETAGDGQLFIVMAYYEGQTLKQRLESGPLPVEQALDLATQVADGLAKAHAQGVVHRDIKPGNLIVTDEGVRILDFGLATFADALKLTAENTAVGTIAYMSPEQVRGLAVDARTDVWAVGAVLYEMLTGHPPFRGSHAEAIGFAIRNETPTPIRSVRPEIPEEIEQLAFRALHKEPAVRHASGRELGRALRQVRGLSVPMELRTEPVVPSVAVRPARTGSRRPWALLASGVLVPIAIVSSLLWPMDRIPVAIAPIANGTGNENLDQYGPGLTEALRYALSESRTVRILDHAQQSAITRRFRRFGREIPSNELQQAISANTQTQILVLPSLVREGVGWRARAEFRDARTASVLAVADTDSFVSAIVDERVYRTLVPGLATRIEEHFRNGSVRRRIAHVLRTLVGAHDAIRLPASTLAAAVAFEKGLDAYEELEYDAAWRSLMVARENDPLNPVLFAWASRVGRLMRRTVEAERLAQQATQLLSNETREPERLLVDAIVAESRGDLAAAEASYRALTQRHPDQVAPLMELGAFQEREGMSDAAIQIYFDVLRMDSRLADPHLRLCQIYNRLTDRARARVQSMSALGRYRELGARGGEAQTLLCMTETARLGTGDERAQAQAHAQAAVGLFIELGYPYGLSRAYNYVALAAESQGRLAEAAAAWERSLTMARTAGNVALEPRVLGNLGVTYKALGDFGRAVDYLSQSYKLNTKLGDEQEAARNLTNLAGIMIAYRNPENAVADLRTALAVSRKLHDANFIVLGLQFLGEYHRYAGRHAAAEQELLRARSVAEENDLDDEFAAIATDLATLKIERGEYSNARDLIVPILAGSAGQDAAHARIRLAQAALRLGDFATAEQELERAASDVQLRSDTGLLPLVYQVRGELAYERGRFAEARNHFTRATSLLIHEWPDVASVESQVNLALLDAISGNRSSAERLATRSLKQATAMGRFTLEAKCRLVLARLAIDTRKFDSALRLLEQVVSDADRTPGAEVLAQRHYLSSRAMEGQGNRTGADAERQAAASLIGGVRALIPETDRPGFESRVGIRSLTH